MPPFEFRQPICGKIGMVSYWAYWVYQITMGFCHSDRANWVNYPWTFSHVCDLGGTVVAQGKKGGQVGQVALEPTTGTKARGGQKHTENWVDEKGCRI